MTRRLKWTSLALWRVEQIGDYIAQDNPTAAANVVTRLLTVCENLSEYPAIGRVGRISGAREFVLSDLPYIVAFRVTERRVEILTVIHTSQRLPEII